MQDRRAAAYLDRLNLRIVAGLAERRQGRAFGEGARSPASIAAGPVRLVEIEEPAAGGGVDRITPLGYRTAIRRNVPLLDGLARRDPRRIIADHLSDTIERMRSTGGQSLEGGSGGSGVSDGGATTRIKHAARERRMREILTPGGMPRLAISPKYKTTKRRPIEAWGALVSICVEGRGLYDILRAHGWRAGSENARPLAEALLDCLDDLADGMGFGRSA